MPDPTTPNLGLFIPLNGADVGTWDVPMNANFSTLDGVLGVNQSVALSNVPITLSPTQYTSNLIIFTGTLTGNVVVTFPAVGRTYWVLNNCGANTSFTVRAQINPANQYVALPPSEVVGVSADGTNMRFVGLGRIGTYWDFAGSAVPLWVTGSNPAPYLNCDGTTFSSGTYPALTDYLGGTTLPDARGRFRAALNQGTGRFTAATSAGLNADTILNSGGLQNIGSVNLPPHTHPLPSGLGVDVDVITGGVTGPSLNVWIVGNDGVTGSAGSGFAYAPPSYAGGLTLIRAG